MVRFCFILIIFCFLIYKNKCETSHRFKKNTNIIIKKLIPIEISENVPIGYTVTDLKANLIDHHKNNDEIYFKFEFLNEDNYQSKNHHRHQHRQDQQEYDLNPFNLRNYFLLDSFTGLLKTSKSLDLENFCDLNLCSSSSKSKVCSIPFKIKASKFFHTNYSTSMKVFKDSVFHILFDLVVLDINEFKPEFFEQKDLILLNVTEEFAPIRLPIGSVASDYDCTDRNNLNYFINIIKVNNQLVDHVLQQSNLKLNDNIKQKFNLSVLMDQTLLFLYSPKAFDRELVQTIELNVIATDRIDSNDAKSGVLKVLINVIDINDNCPKFQNQIINLEFDEGLPIDTEIIRLNAIDLDDDLNAKIQYEFTNLNEDIKETFALNSTTGVLTLNKRLNYDQKNYWQLSVRATDQSLSTRKSSIALINLRVNDINNHKPEISLNLFSTNGFIGSKLIITKDVDLDTITKDEIIYLFYKIPINSAIGTITVTDKDSQLNGLIDNCELIFPNEVRLIYLEPLNDELNSSFIFTTNELLNKELDSMYRTDLPISGNEKKYLIRTNTDFRDKNGGYKFEIRASDSGINFKLFENKSFTIIVVESNDNSKIENFELDNDNNQLFNIININNNQENYDLEDGNTNVKSIYNINLKENNKYPIELAKFTPNDFEISTEVFYNVLLIPPAKSFNDLHLKVLKCSSDLYKYLFIGQLTGALVLNSSLDRELCDDYLYIIRASHLIEKRLSSIIYLRLHVQDQNDNRPSFEHNNYVFTVAENIEVNKIIGHPIRIIDADSELSYDLTVDIISNDETESHFTILKENKSISLILKKPFDYEIKNKYELKLVASDGVSSNGNNLSKLTFVEINIVDANEHKPFVKQLHATLKNNSINITKISNVDEDYFIVANLDHLVEFKRHDSLVDLIKIEAQDLDLNEKYSKLNYSISSVKYYQKAEISSRKLIKELDTQQGCDIFYLKNAYLGVDLNGMESCPIPLVILMVIRISDQGEPILYTNLNLKLILINKSFAFDKLNEMQNYLIEKYSTTPNFYLTSQHSESNLTKLKDSNTKQMNHVNKIKNKSFKELFSTIHPPLVIISILILVLILTVISLFIMSIIYSVSVCKFFKCKVNNVFKGEEILEDKFLKEQRRALSLRRASLENKYDSKEKHGSIIDMNNDEYYEYDDEEDEKKADDLNRNKTVFRNKLVSWLSNSKKVNEPNESCCSQNNSKCVESENAEYLLDSPIMLRKFNDMESQSNYMRKNHLEYLMDQNHLSFSQKISTPIKEKPTKGIKKVKKITFNCDIDKDLSPNSTKHYVSTTISTSPDESHLNSSSNDEMKKIDYDDDLIIPFKKSSSFIQNIKVSTNRNMNNIKRQQQQKKKLGCTNKNESYKKATFQPEDNIWIKKVIPQQIPNQNFINNEIVI